MNSMVMLVKREFWEHRSLWIAPLVWVGVIVVLAAWLFFWKARHFDGNMQNMQHDRPVIEYSDEGRRIEAAPEVPPQVTNEEANAPSAEASDAADEDPDQEATKDSEAQSFTTFSFLVVFGLISGFVIIVLFFYLIDCLFTERRDRSILFWKSLPVSDSQVVLSKLATAMVAVPVGVLALSAATQFVLYCIVWLKFQGTLVGAELPDWNFVGWLRAQLIGLSVMIGGLLWYAPIAAYLLLLSAWARRLVFLWAIVPLIAIPALEGVFNQSTNFLQFLGYRLGGHYQHMNLDERVFNTIRDSDHLPRIGDVLSSLSLRGIFASVDMWLGLLVAAAMIYAAIHIRRHRDES